MFSSNLIMGPELWAMQAQNLATIQGELITMEKGVFSAGTLQEQRDGNVELIDVPSYQLQRTTVTNEMYDKYIRTLGSNSRMLIATAPAGGQWLLAVGDDDRKLLDAVKNTPHDKLFPDGVFEDLQRIGSSVYVINTHVHDNPKELGFDRPLQPVINTDWLDAAVYALFHGCMLPTRLQWMFAARVFAGQNGGLRDYATKSGTLNHKEVHYGVNLPSNLDPQALIKSGAIPVYGEETTVDVDDPRYSDDGRGFRHLTGNVWQWMGDYMLPKGAKGSPKDPGNSHYILRGGAFFTKSEQELATYFSAVVPASIYNASFGFRVARSLP